jgi:hypothetical protein
MRRDRCMRRNGIRGAYFMVQVRPYPRGKIVLNINGDIL